MLHTFLAQVQTAAPTSSPTSGIGFFVPFISFSSSCIRDDPATEKATGTAKAIDRECKDRGPRSDNAGIHGLISNVKETTVIVKVADNVKIEMEKSAIANVAQRKLIVDRWLNR